MGSPNDRPVLVQGSDAALIRVTNGGDGAFLCGACGHLLIHGYHPECAVGIDIECYRCKHVTRTPGRRAGVRLHPQLVRLGNDGRYFVGSTIEQPVDVMLICEHEIAAERAEMGASEPESTSLELSERGLALLVRHLDLLSGGMLTPRLRSAERAFATGNRNFRENELAWAVTVLRERLGQKTLHFDRSALMATMFINTTSHLLGRWRNHPTIARRALELCTDFRHALTLMIAATYLEEHGNAISFNPAGSQPSPDLFIRTRAAERLYLEVKAPEALAWPNVGATRSQLRSVVERCLRKARAQIGSRRPGILVIGSSCVEPLNIVSNLERAVRAVFRAKGADHRGIAAITIVAAESHSSQLITARELSLSSSFRVTPIKNPHYFRPNPLRS
jgi:hypothetical protein